MLHNQRCFIDIEDQYQFVRQRIENMEPWGDFQLPKIEEIAGLRFWFYKVPVGKIKKISATVQAWQIVYRDHRFAYIVVLSKAEPPVNAMLVPRIHLGSLSLSHLCKQLDKFTIEIEDLRAERESLTRWIFLINKKLAETENMVALAHAKSQTQDSEGIFFIQGWVPCRNVDQLTKFGNNYHLALMTEDPAANEMPPTLLENPKLLRGAESLVNFYQTPGYRSCDPTIVFFFHSACFFP